MANETTINDGGIQTVSANGEAIKTKINEGGTLTVNDNGKATDIVQNSGAALQTSTANGIEISGTHQYGTFSISGNLATNMLLENGGNLLVLAGTEARDSTVGSGGAANGSYRSNGLGGHIETGMRFTDGNWNLTPYASLTGVHR